MTRTALLALGLLLVAPGTPRAQAPDVELVADINPGSGSARSLGRYAVLNDVLYFAADDGTHGRELWRSDGTEAGTRMVTDIRPGADGSLPYRFVTFGGVLYFIADDGATGYELWRSDGTASGTVLVKDIRAGSPSGDPDRLTVFDGALYFSARSDAHGTELWRSDGTTDGTQLVIDLNPGALSGIGGDLTVLGGTLYFTGSDGMSGSELWQTDGTAAGTSLVADINTGSESSFPAQTEAVGGMLLFIANDGTTGRELWRSDGTAAGTALVSDINTGSEGSTLSFTCFHQSDRAVHDGALFFRADDGAGAGVWRSDGTTAGTTLLGRAGNPCALTAAGGAVYFNAFGDDLWRTDGTAAGTEQLATLTRVNGFVDFDGAVYFKGGDATHGEELWLTDGTDAGTRRAHDLDPGAGSGVSNSGDRYAVVDLVPYRGSLYFRGNDGTSGFELWRLTPAATSGEPGPDAASLQLEVGPNPVRGRATLMLQAGETGTAHVAVYDALGRQIAVLHEGPIAAGATPLRFDTGGLAPGVYVVRARTAQGAAVSRSFTVIR